MAFTLILSQRKKEKLAFGNNLYTLVSFKCFLCTNDYDKFISSYFRTLKLQTDGQVIDVIKIIAKDA